MGISCRKPEKMDTFGVFRIRHTQIMWDLVIHLRIFSFEAGGLSNEVFPDPPFIPPKTDKSIQIMG